MIILQSISASCRRPPPITNKSCRVAPNHVLKLLQLWGLIPALDDEERGKGKGKSKDRKSVLHPVIIPTHIANPMHKCAA